jgi:hypothetical protein
MKLITATWYASTLFCVEVATYKSKANKVERKKKERRKEGEEGEDGFI